MTPYESFLLIKNGLSNLKQLVLLTFLYIYIYIYVYIYTRYTINKTIEIAYRNIIVNNRLWENVLERIFI